MGRKKSNKDNKGGSADRLSGLIRKGVTFQHSLCTFPQFVRKKITKGWVDAQIEKQCVDWGDNEYSHEYFPDGIYYSYNIWSNKRE
jgi:hypothetical protein